MSSKLRVFVSSTMKDLANERYAVVDEIKRFNFEPVNAESWLPNGSKCWTMIEEELRSSHLFVLLLGDSYGWKPRKGPGAAARVSVTHMEARYAKEAGMPVLAFLKHLDYGSPRNPKRDQFREEMRDWESGRFTREFHVYADLAKLVGEALVGVLIESYLKERVRAQAKAAQPVSSHFAPRAQPQPVSLPDELIDILRRDDTVLLAGAGMSLAAGYPGAHGISELILAGARRRGASGVNLGLTGSIQEMSENLELAYGRSAVLEVHRSAFSPPQTVRPLAEHFQALRLFRTIVTTNHDELLESAARESGRDCTVVTDDAGVPPPMERSAIVKIAGTLSQPQSLVITGQDARGVRDAKPELWHWLTTRLGNSPLVVVGHSLRDYNAKALVKARPRHLPGFIVGNEIGSFDAGLFEELGLRAVHADVQSFFDCAVNMVGR